ncbi:MAG TPA: ABC transporter permease [Candidatus Acidoferrales bacterium]|nr:ABC transporter permease [Candidatus Acidoferrales bacterium]
MMLDTIAQDARFAARTLAKNRGFTVIAILTLALGIGACAAIFSVVDAVLLRPLPYPNPQRIVTVWEKEANGHRTRLADPNFLDFRSQNHTLAGLATFISFPDSISGGSEPARVNVALVTQDFFKVMGVEPIRGREFTAGELQVHGAPAMIVSYGYWQKYLGAKADLSQVHLTMDGKAYSVVGVMPRGFDYAGANVAIWAPREPYGWSDSRSSHNGEGIARLRDGVTLEQARADLDTIARRIHDQYGKQEISDYFLTDATAIPLSEVVVENVRPALIALFGAVALMFLVGCANVAGLLLARTSARRKELAMRSALGAGRGRLVQQLLVESLALAIAGGALGTLLAVWTTQFLPAILPASLPRQQGIAINGSVLLFTLATTLIVAIGLGLFAAWRAGEGDLSEALSAGARGYSSASQKARSSLVIAEIAATLVLLVGAGLLGRSFLRLIAVSPGFSSENLLLLKFSLPQSQEDLTPQQKQAEIARQTQFLDSALERVEAIPGIKSAGLAGALPVADADGFNDGVFLVLNGHPAPTNFDEWGRMALNAKQTGQADRAVASAGFFRTTGIPLIQGRMFGPQDGPEAPNVALISQRLARKRWPNQDPVGQVIDFSNMDGILKPLTIIGIVGDVRAEGLDRPMTPLVYVDYRQRGMGNGSPAIIVRTAMPSGAIVPAARDIFHRLDPNVPVEFSTFDEALGGWMAQRRFLLFIAGLFAAAALALAAIGIYGLLSYAVARRTQEIGVRVALGAQHSDVLRLILGEGSRLAAIGVAAGIAVSFAVTRLMSALLFGIEATDPATFAAVAVLLILVALFASYIPARRAMRVDPIVALRYE